MFVKDDIIPHIRDNKTSKETWDILKGLYETSNANQILFLKTKLISIKMEANESIGNFVSIMKYLSDKLCDIGEKVSNSDLVTISLKGLVQYYKVFMSALSARQTPPIFDELVGILLQEEERMTNYDLDSSGSYLALIARGKRSYQGKSWDKNMGRIQAKQKGMTHHDSYVKRNIECDDENSWFIDSGASAHRPVIKKGMINIMRKLMAHTFTQEITDHINSKAME